MGEINDVAHVPGKGLVVAGKNGLFLIPNKGENDYCSEIILVYKALESMISCIFLNLIQINITLMNDACLISAEYFNCEIYYF